MSAESQPSRSTRRRSRGSIILMLAGALGGVLYSAYVGIGLVFGLTMVSAAIPRPAPAQATAAEPAPAPRLQAAGIDIAIPQVVPPLAVAAVAPEIPVSPLALIPDWKGTDRINVLLLGVDQREDERALGLATRSDTMIVVSIDPVQKSATMISFPRDLWVRIPGYGQERINVAYRFGELNRIPGGGPGVAARTIEQNFGLRTSYYATVDFRGFQEIVDTLDGLVIDVLRPIRDDQYPTDNYGVERVFFSSGPQLMDGLTALKYARTRHADNDFGRMARQQQVLFAIRDRALRLNVLPRLPTLLDQGMRAVQTNLTPADLLSLAKLSNDIELAAVGTLVIDGELVVEARGPAAVLLPKTDQIRRAIQKAMADPRMLRESARVEITSPLARAQLAQLTVNCLAGEGFQVGRQNVPPASEPETTSVLVYTDKPRSLDAVLKALHLPPDVVQISPDPSNVDIRINLGRDFQLPPAS